MNINPFDGTDLEAVRELVESVVQDEGRLDALRSVGVLDELPDPTFDRLTQLAARLLDAPVALMSFVDEDRQFFAAQHGLTGWASEDRQTPLSHSFCQYVVGSGQKLAVTDARTDLVLADNKAIPDLGVVAYAGVPIADPDGNQLGSFCVIDDDAREWSQNELDVLETLSLAIVNEIALRRALHKERQASQAASDAIRSLLAMQQITATLSGAVDADEIFAGVLDVARRTGASSCRLVLSPSTGLAWLHEAQWSGEGTATVDAGPLPGDHRLAAELDRHVTGPHGSLPSAGLVLGDEGGSSLWHVRGSERTVALVELQWQDRADASEATANLMAATAASLGPVVERVFLREDERLRARELQLGLLPRDLPDVEGHRLDRIYQPALEQLDVGGDWYDAVLVDPTHLLLVVGDANGHSALAAATMASLRFGLRALAREDADPAWLLGELNGTAYADHQLATAALVLLHLPTGEFYWSSAGHPPPVIAGPDGARALATSGGAMLGAVEDTVFPTDQDTLLPGERLVLYTDGLVEGRDDPMDVGIDLLVDLLGVKHDATPSQIVTVLAEQVRSQADDDIAMLTVHRQAEGPDRG